MDKPSKLPKTRAKRVKSVKNGSQTQKPAQASPPDFKMLRQACKLITEYALKELTLHVDGSITIVKEVHAQPQMKPQKVEKKPTAQPPSYVNMSEVDLALVAARLPSQNLNDFNRYQTKTILPKQGES